MPIYPGYVSRRRLAPDRRAGQVDRGPHRQPDLDRIRARLPHARRDLLKNGKITGLRVDVLSDQGAFYGTAQPTKFRAGLLPHRHGSYDIPASHVRSRRCTRTRRRAASPTAARSASPRPSYLDRAARRRAAYELGVDPIELRMSNFIQPEQFPYEYDDRVRRTTPATTPRRCGSALDMLGYEELRREQAEKRARGGLIGIGVALLHRGGRRRDRQARRHRRAGHVRLGGAASAPDRQGDAQARRASRRARATRRRSRRSSPRSSASRPRTSRSGTATPTTRRTASARTRAARRRSAGAATAVVARKLRDKARLIAATMLETRPEDLEWSTAAGTSRERPITAR